MVAPNAEKAALYAVVPEGKRDFAARWEEGKGRELVDGACVYPTVRMPLHAFRPSKLGPPLRWSSSVSTITPSQLRSNGRTQARVGRRWMGWHRRPIQAVPLVGKYGVAQFYGHGITRSRAGDWPTHSKSNAEVNCFFSVAAAAAAATSRSPLVPMARKAAGWGPAALRTAGGAARLAQPTVLQRPWRAERAAIATKCGIGRGRDKAIGHHNRQ